MLKKYCRLFDIYYQCRGLHWLKRSIFDSSDAHKTHKQLKYILYRERERGCFRFQSANWTHTLSTCSGDKYLWRDLWHIRNVTSLRWWPIFAHFSGTSFNTHGPHGGSQSTEGVCQRSHLPYQLYLSQQRQRDLPVCRRPTHQPLAPRDYRPQLQYPKSPSPLRCVIAASLILFWPSLWKLFSYLSAERRMLLYAHSLITYFESSSGVLRLYFVCPGLNQGNELLHFLLGSVTFYAGKKSGESKCITKSHKRAFTVLIG